MNSDDWESLDAARKRRAREWARHDGVLYEMCARYPRHADPASVNAKVGIIARAYATGIERKVPSDRESQGSALVKLTGFLVKHGARIDQILRPVRRIREPLTPAKLETIVEQHGKLVALLKPLLHRGQASRSFWSKYMHFHCRAVPVYDSFAARRLRSLVRWRQELEVFVPKKPFDAAYCWHAMRFLRLYEHVRVQRVSVTVKDLDFYLLASPARSRRARTAQVA